MSFEHPPPFPRDGKIIDWRERYLSIYAGELDQLMIARRSVRLLEIGFRTVDPLSFGKYFRDGSGIVGDRSNSELWRKEIDDVKRGAARLSAEWQGERNSLIPEQKALNIQAASERRSLVFLLGQLQSR
jgi:hypothetical protein